MASISIVTSLYQSAPYIRDFHARHVHCLQQLGVEYQFVFVNDGSPDNSEAVVRELMLSYGQITLISLSRNFGQYPAMFAGLRYARGDLVCAVDSDLEEPPENLLLLYEELHRSAGIDVVYGIVERRTGGFWRRWLGTCFHRLLAVLSDVQIPPNQGWQRLMTRRYVDALLQYREVETLPAGLMTLAGFTQLPLVISKSFKGQSSYSLARRVRLALNSITAFSSRPLVLVGVTGLIITSGAFLMVLIVVLKKLFVVDYAAGWSSLLASIWLVGGLILSSIGIVGIYLAKVFNQTKNRPLYIVKSVEGECPQPTPSSGAHVTL